MTLPFPTDALSQDVAVLGRKNSGKTYMAKGCAEELLRLGRRLCIIDPTGVWWGLRLQADGKTPAFPVVIFGGEHADVPIAATAGADLADVIAERNIPTIIDLSNFNMTERHRFVAEFLGHLHRINRAPLHIFIDEADESAPQNPMPETKRVLHEVDRLVRRGRVRGFRVMLITQRPAVLHKNVLTQANMLVAMRMPGPQDRAAIEAWIKDQADPGQAKDVLSSLAGLQRGEGWVWAPELGILERVTFPPITTFDSSRSPGEGEEIEEPATLGEIDLGDLRARLAPEAEPAPSNASAKMDTPDPEVLDRAREEGYRAGFEAGRAEGFEAGFALAKGKSLDAIERGAAEVRRAVMEMTIPRAEGQAVKPPEIEGKETGEKYSSDYSEPLAIAEVDTRAPLPAAASPAPKSLNSRATGAPAPAQQRILDALAWLATAGIAPAPRIQVALAAKQSPSSSGFANNLGALRTAGLIDYPAGGTVALTSAGRARAAAPRGRLTSADLHQFLSGRLPPAQWRIVSALIAAHPKALAKEELARRVAASATSSGYANNLGALRSLGFIDYPQPGRVVALPVLFVEGKR